MLEIAGVHALSDRGLPALVNISLTVREGEILGIAGVAGNGQAELAQVVTGLRPVERGKVTVDGRDLTGAGPSRYLRAGVGHIPEDRLGMGLVGALSVTDNAILREYRDPPLARGTRLDLRAAARLTRQIVARAADADSRSAHAGAKPFGWQPATPPGRPRTRVASRLLVAVHPTQGLDIGATKELRHVLMEQRNEGRGVLLISEDLDEILIMSDRIAIMYGGRIAGVFDTSAADRDSIGLLMGGASLPAGGARPPAEEVKG